MKNLNITKGEWRGKEIPNEGVKIKTAEWIQRGFADGIAEHINNHDDAELICDAGNTYQRCGKLPSELEKENERLKIEREYLLLRLSDGDDYYTIENGKIIHSVFDDMTHELIDMGEASFPYGNYELALSALKGSEA